MPAPEDQILRCAATSVSKSSTSTAVEKLDPEPERWNSPSINKYRFASACLSFFLIGATDGIGGVLLPALEAFYDKPHDIIGLTFITPTVGFTLTALLSDKAHTLFGQRGIAVAGPACRLIASVVAAVQPPFGVLVAVMSLNGVSAGLINSSYCTWVNQLQDEHFFSGFLSACYGFGATAGPLFGASMVEAGLPWGSVRGVIAALSVVELIIGTASFWKFNGPEYRRLEALNASAETKIGSTMQRLKFVLRRRVTWAISAFLFLYCGMEVTVGAWITTFMREIRHGEAFASGLVSAGFWGGLALGRLALGPVTSRIGERAAVATYLSISLAMQLVAWLVPSFAATAAGVALFGFASGPLFSTATIAITKLLPKEVHNSGMGVINAFCGVGGAALPGVAGALLTKTSLISLEPSVVSLLVAMGALWLLVPALPRSVSRSTTQTNSAQEKGMAGLQDE